MALVNQAWTVNVTFRDRDRNVSNLTAYRPATETFADVDGWATTFVNQAAALSDGVLIGYSIGRTVIEDAPAVPAESSDVERKGVFTFLLGDTRKTRVSIPSISNSVVVDNSNLIDANNIGVGLFITSLVTGGSDSIGTDIIRVQRAYKMHRGSSKG